MDPYYMNCVACTVLEVLMHAKKGDNGQHHHVSLLLEQITVGYMSNLK